MTSDTPDPKNVNPMLGIRPDAAPYDARKKSEERATLRAMQCDAIAM